MPERMRWYARGTPPSAEQLALLVQHVEHWREKVPGYGLLVPPERAAGAQLYGELLILERIRVRGALPENVNYAIKSSYLLSFLESVPEVSAKLKEPETKERKFEDVVKSAEQAAVLVLVY